MLSKDEMFKYIDEYFQNATEEQFLSDLEDLNCLDMVEEAIVDRDLTDYHKFNMVINDDLINLSGSSSVINNAEFSRISKGLFFKRSEIVANQVKGQTTHDVVNNYVYFPIGA